MKHRTSLFSIFVVLTMLLVACGGDNATTTSTTTNSHPLFEMLKHAPIQFETGEISYLDFRAVEDALPYVDQPAEGQVIYDNWMGYTMRWYALPYVLNTGGIQMLEDALQQVGVEFRRINRTLSFGATPQFNTVWSGDFDEEAIRTAYTARGYQRVDINGFEAWCGGGDCDNTISDNQSTTSIFDSDNLKLPILLTDDLVVSVSSPVLDELTAPNAKTLYDSLNILTLAQAATAPEGLLVNWMVIPVTSADTQNGRYTPEDIQPAISNGYAYQNLPVYRAVAFADRQEGDRTVCLIMLVYGDSATAESASAELSARLTNFTEYTMTRQTITRDEEGGLIFMDIPGMAITHSVYSSPTTGLFVAVVRMAYDTPTSEQAHAIAGSAESYVPNSPAFRYIFASAFIRRDFYPIWTVWNK